MNEVNEYVKEKKKTDMDEEEGKWREFGNPKNILLSFPSHDVNLIQIIGTLINKHTTKKKKQTMKNYVNEYESKSRPCH